jgi:hypothetical protein
MSIHDLPGPVFIGKEADAIVDVLTFGLRELLGECPCECHIVYKDEDKVCCTCAAERHEWGPSTIHGQEVCRKCLAGREVRGK